MGAVGGMLGTAGGAGGTGFKNAEGANIQQGTSVEDVKKAQERANASLDAQNSLLSALSNQNGIDRQNALADQLAQANGLRTQNQAIAGLQGTAGQYQNIVNGTGPNPARAMLNQATGQNVANQAALMAGQRGAGANVGLMARQAAQQGANTQQQAVGQGAVMQANQSLNALQGLSNTQQAFGNMGANQAQMQAALANQMVGQRMAGTQAGAQGALANAQQNQNALGQFNSAQVGSQSSVNAANAGNAQAKMGQQGQIIGGAMSGAGAAMSMAEGGEVAEPQGASSSYGNFLKGWTGGTQPEAVNASSEKPTNPLANPGLQKGASDLTAALMSRKKTQNSVNSESMAGEAAPMQQGTMVAAKGGLASTGGHVKAKAPAQQAEKGGDSYDNDKVPAMLSEGEIVLPRSVTMSKDPVKASAAFVQKVLAKRRGK